MSDMLKTRCIFFKILLLVIIYLLQTNVQKLCIKIYEIQKEISFLHLHFSIRNRVFEKNVIEDRTQERNVRPFIICTKRICFP